MPVDTTLGLLLAATIVNAIMVGATLDQSIKQLPARHRIGPLAYAGYAKAADFAGGLRYYPALGAATLLATPAAAIAGMLNQPTSQQATALITAAAGTIAHTLVTARAAPTFLSLRRVNDEQTAAVILNRFTKLQTLRATLQILTAAATIWALAATITRPNPWPNPRAGRHQRNRSNALVTHRCSIPDGFDHLRPIVADVVHALATGTASSPGDRPGRADPQVMRVAQRGFRHLHNGKPAVCVERPTACS